MMQVKIGTGGGSGSGSGGGVRMQFGGGGAIRSAVQSMASPENWLLDAGIVLAVIIVIMLAVLIVRELYLQKKNKK